MSREEKLLDNLEMILNKNLQAKDKFNIQQEILNDLHQKDVH